MNVAFNRDLKHWYSWLPVGKTSKFINNRVSCRWTMISAIFSDGNHFWMITQNTDSSIEFWDFISVLDYLIKHSSIWNVDNIVSTLDNASPHKSFQTYQKLKQLGLSFVFQPPYSPNLAPVELFFRAGNGIMIRYFSDSNIN